MFGSISSAGSSSSAKSRSRAWLRDSLQEQAAREARAREKRRAKLAERSAERGGRASRRWYHDLCSANSVDRPCPPNRQTLGALGRAASLETTGVGAAAREELQEEEVVLSDLPPTYSQLDLASPPPSYGPDLEMVVVSPPPKYAGDLDYESLMLRRQELPIDEISRKWEEMRVN